MIDSSDIFVFGSCRVIGPLKRLQLISKNSIVCHSCNEVTQILEVMKGNKTIPDNLIKRAFRYQERYEDIKNVEFLENLNKSKIVIIEISSIKAIIHNNVYLSLAIRHNVGKPVSLDLATEYEKMINHPLLKDKLILLVPHCNVKLDNGCYIKNRQIIEDFVKNVAKCNASIIPGEIITNIGLDKAMPEFENGKRDVNHYSEDGIIAITAAFEALLNTL